MATLPKAFTEPGFKCEEFYQEPVCACVFVTALLCLPSLTWSHVISCSILHAVMMLMIGHALPFHSARVAYSFSPVLPADHR